MERSVALITGHALRDGARVGLEVLTREALRLSGAREVAVCRGRGRRALAVARCTPPPALLRRREATRVLRPPDRGASLVVRGAPGDGEIPEALEPLAALASALLVAHERESEEQARHLRLLRERRHLLNVVAHQERRRRRASHDLRTPLLVIQGYVGMLKKGAAGPLSPTMHRYLDALQRAATDQGTLIERRLCAETPPEDLCAALRSAFGRSRRVRTRINAEGPAALVKAPRPALEVLLSTLARGVAATGADTARLTLEAPGDSGQWGLRLSARAERPLPAPFARRLEALARKLGGTVSLARGPGVDLTLRLPAAASLNG
ncbi:histidine kinase dimerization/phospho-acceptor domain-containing protein [Myxococcaceae bacterium GXIMD 01537]